MQNLAQSHSNYFNLSSAFRFSMKGLGTEFLKFGIPGFRTQNIIIRKSGQFWIMNNSLVNVSELCNNLTKYCFS